MSEDDLDTLGRLVDKLENALASLEMPLPPALHIEGMKGIVTDVRDSLKLFVVDRLGHNPWEFQP